MLSQRLDAAAAAFNAKFFNHTSGLYGGGSQAEQVPALFLELAPSAADRTRDEIKSKC